MYPTFSATKESSHRPTFAANQVSDSSFHSRNLSKGPDRAGRTETIPATPFHCDGILSSNCRRPVAAEWFDNSISLVLWPTTTYHDFWRREIWLHRVRVCDIMTYGSGRSLTSDRGGTAGCVVAARLAETPEIKVLLLEAGQHNKDLENVHMTGGWALPRLSWK